jgi:hypothetical protein
VLLSLLLLLIALPLLAQPLPSALNQRQAPDPSVNSDLTFCVWGDCRPGGDYNRYRVTTSIMRAIVLERPQFVLGLGDYIDGARGLEATRQQWLRFFSAIVPLQKPTPIPLALAIGNHDSGSALFGQYFGRRYFSFDAGAAHFIILDSEQPGQVGRIAGTQWEWLKQDLTAAANAQLIFVAVHQPLFPVSVHRGSSLDAYPPYRDRLHLLFVQHKVSAVFAAHEHMYHHQQRDGVHYFISAGAGAPLYAQPKAGGFYHYLVVKCTDNNYVVEVKRLEQ